MQFLRLLLLIFSCSLLCFQDTNAQVGINGSGYAPRANTLLDLRNDTTGADSSVVIMQSGALGIGTSNPSGRFHIKNNLGVGTDSAFVVTDAGFVGIGTTSPDSTLHISGSSRTDGNVKYTGNLIDGQGWVKKSFEVAI